MVVFFLVDAVVLAAVDFLVAEVECVLAGAVEVSFLWAQEMKNATVARAVIEKRTDFFIGWS